MFLSKSSKLAIIIFLFINLIPAFSAPITERYKELLENGSITEIKKAMNKDIDFFRFRIDEQEDTILMYAIEKKRPLEIIQLLYKSGTRTYWKNKNKQSALSYVCKYSDDDDVIKFILEKSGSKNTTKRRLLQKDIEGLSPYDYAKQNPYTSIMQLIEPYFTEAEFDASVVKMPSAKATYVQETKPEPQKPVVVQKPENPPVSTEEKKVEPKEVEPKVEKKVEPKIVEQKKVEPKIEKKEEPIKVVEKPKKITEEKPATLVVKETPKETKKEPKKQVKIEPIAVSKYEKQYLYDFAPSENEVIPEDINANNVHELAHIDSPNKADENGTTLLMKAAKTGNKWALESLIKSGANVYSKDKDGWTALMYAVRYQNNVEIINSLIEHGANVKDKNNFGTSVLQLAACYAENPEILKKILSYYKVGDNDFFKSFILAITTHPSSTVSQIAKLEIFIDRGVPLNRFHEGKTPLMYAAEYATSTKVIKLLLDNGAISSIRNPHGKTAFDFAETNTLIPHDEIYWSLNTGR